MNHPLRFNIAASSSVPWIYMAQFWNTCEENGSKIAKEKEVEISKEKEVELTKETEVEITQETPVVNITNVVIPVNVNDENEEITDEVYELKTREKGKIRFRRHKNKVGMQIPAWMITDEMKLTEHYRMYAKVFGIDVPLTQSQPTESTQGTHRTTSAPMSPNPNKEAKSSAPSRSTVIRLRIPERNVVDDSSIPRNDESNIPGTKKEPMSNKESPEVEITKDKEVEITKETPVVDITNVVIPVNVNDEDEEITDEVYELKRMEKGKIVEETRNSPIPTPIRSPRIHTNLVSSDTEKLQKLTHTHTTSSSSSPHKKLAKMNRLLSLFKTKPTRFKHYKSFFQELQGRYGYLFAHLQARFMPRKSFDTLVDNLHDVMVETLPTMVDKHIKEQVMKQVHEQVQNQVPVYVAEGLILERQKAKEKTERLIAKAILQERGNIQAQISTQIENAISNVIPSQVYASVRSYMSRHILHVHPAQSQTSSVLDQQYQLYLAMKADPQLQQQDIAIWLALQMKFERNTVLQTACRTPAVHPRDQDDPHDDAHPEGENSAKRQKTSEYEAYVSGESSSGQVFQEEQAPSTLGNQEQDDDFDFWTDSYASDDDEIPSKQRCTSGDEHQYHIDQMKNFLKSDIVWESRKEILVSPYPRRTTPLVHSCQKDPEAPVLSLINQEYVARTPQQNGVVERKNRTLIEAARTMLEDSLLPIVFWVEAVNTACYILNRVLVTKAHNKTPYELIIGRAPSISCMRPFGCPITILNTLDPLGKFDGKAEEGFLVGYSVNSKAFK
ncbi:retrovirus-related pol polyprotein from transposon TNT 1-94, partial [Tanacetum coccineum]